MDRWATKDHYEVETEESERLIHPAPKIKPPRHDRRRERMDPDYDPDINGDPDIAHDKDMSLNYKNVGGSIAARVLSRHLGYDPLTFGVASRFFVADLDRGDLVQVVNKDDKHVNVTEKTLKEHGDEYTKVEGEEDEKGAPKKDDAFYGGAGQELAEKSKKDPRFEALMKSVMDGSSMLGGIAERTPNFEVSKALPGHELPKGIETMGDLKRALGEAAKSKGKGKEKGRGKGKAPKEEAAPVAAPKKEEPKLEEKPVAVPKEEPAQVPPGAPPGALPEPKDGEKVAPPPEPQEEKAQVPPPERPKASKQEEDRAEAALTETLPEDIAEQVSGMGLHPEDVSHLISGYKSAMSRDLSEGDIQDLAKGLSEGGGYNLNPEHIEPPEDLYINGEEVKFSSLSPEMQAEAFAQYKMHVVATSLAAREQIAGHLEKSGLPPAPAKVITEAMLKSGGGDLSDDTIQNFYSQALSTAFAEHPLKEKEIDQVLKAVGDNPTAKKLVAAYVQASNYEDARNRFLSNDPDHRETRIAEWDKPEDISKKLEAASEFLRKRSEKLPLDTRIVDPALDFRNRVMDRLGALAPEKVPIIREHLQDYEHKVYEEKLDQSKKAERSFGRAFKKEKGLIEKERGGAAQQGAYRSLPEPTKEEIEGRLAKRGITRPVKPTMPPGFKHWKQREEVEKSTSGAMGWLKKLFSGFTGSKDESKEKPKGKAKKKQAAALTVEQRVALRTLIPSLRQRVAFRHEMGLTEPSVSSYSGHLSMASSSPTVHTAVYWGQQPYEQTAPYEGWTQLQARDFNAQDFDNILKAARDWLKLPVLGRPIAGLYPDTQFRAALDLALRDHDGGKYSGGVYPTVYNELLAKLSSDPGPYELATGKPEEVPVAGVKAAGVGAPVKSTYAATTERGTIMKASAEVRLFAARVAQTTSDPELAFDMLTLADRMAAEEQGQGQGQGQGQQQAPAQQAEEQKQAAIRLAAVNVNKFNTVRSLVIRAAAQNPTLRDLFLPILQAVK